jgi:beta-lactamase class A
VLAVGVEDLATGRVTGVAVDRPMPMQSVFKAFLAAAVLAAVDSGRLALDSAVVLTRADLAPPFSPVAAAWPGRARYTVGELVEAAAGASDNTAADVLMRLVGGPAAVTAFLRATASAASASTATNASSSRSPSASRRPHRVGGGLGVRRGGRRGAADSAARGRARLPHRPARHGHAARRPRVPAPAPGRRAPVAGVHAAAPRRDDAHPTGARRLRAGLPPGATLAHKTGTGRTEQGLSTAVNDIGVARLPDGPPVAIAAFLAGSAAPEADREALFAEVARLATRPVPHAAPAAEEPAVRGEGVMLLLRRWRAGGGMRTARRIALAHCCCSRVANGGSPIP